MFVFIKFLLILYINMGTAKVKTQLKLAKVELVHCQLKSFILLRRDMWHVSAIARRNLFTVNKNDNAHNVCHRHIAMLLYM